ncbi:MAG: TauD/TfdA family dioxygenase [Polyangiaceae bacterium]|jgi:alpha-ketoglutarate-dependent taurine dioxygenase|nr:TauD/TfdA family dioxygenase [Polyangiaceae bacterium]
MQPGELSSGRAPEPNLGPMRASLRERGFAFVTGLPAGFDHLSFLRAFGHPQPQYGGARTMAITPKAGGEDLYHSLSTQELYPHTEAYEFEGPPPRYLALWCEKPADCGGGLTYLSDFWAFWHDLPPEFRRQVEGKRTQFSSTPGLIADSLGVKPTAHAVAEEQADGHLLVRFSTRCMGNDDPTLTELVARFVEYDRRHRISVRWSRRDLLIWDNHRIAHSRSSFEDRSRRLIRVWLDPAGPEA